MARAARAANAHMRRTRSAPAARARLRTPALGRTAYTRPVRPLKPLKPTRSAPRDPAGLVRAHAVLRTKQDEQRSYRTTGRAPPRLDGELRGVHHSDIKSEDVDWVDPTTLDEAVSLTSPALIARFVPMGADLAAVRVFLLRFPTVRQMLARLQTHTWLVRAIPVLEPAIVTALKRGVRTARIRPRPVGRVVLVSMDAPDGDMGGLMISGAVREWLFAPGRRVGVVVLSDVRDEGPLDVERLATFGRTS